MAVVGYGNRMGTRGKCPVCKKLVQGAYTTLGQDVDVKYHYRCLKKAEALKSNAKKKRAKKAKGEKVAEETDKQEAVETQD